MLTLSPLNMQCTGRALNSCKPLFGPDIGSRRLSATLIHSLKYSCCLYAGPCVRNLQIDEFCIVVWTNWHVAIKLASNPSGLEVTFGIEKHSMIL